METVDVGRRDRLILQAAGQPAIHVSGPESVDELARYLDAADELEQRFGRPLYVDARWRDRLFLGRAVAGVASMQGNESAKGTGDG